VAARGEILALKRRVGFGAGGATERFLVVQSDGWSGLSESVAVVPLDLATAVYARYPGAVRVSAREAGGGGEHVVIADHLVTVALDRFEPAAVGRLRPTSLSAVDEVLRVVLELP
jgi:mRNA-degrading endonuclease toxin of MazEF toxin-antitoxin module